MIGKEFCATKLAPLSGSSRLTKTAKSLYQIIRPLITLGTRAGELRHGKILPQTGTGNNTDRPGRMSRMSRISRMRPLLPVGDARPSIAPEALSRRSVVAEMAYTCFGRAKMLKNVVSEHQHCESGSEAGAKPVDPPPLP